MLTAAVQEFFSWEVGPEAIANFDVLPGELKDEFGTSGVRPDLLFDFKDGERVLAGEARGRSSLGPQGAATRKDQRQRLKDMLAWSRDHDDYPVAMTWAYLGGAHAQVDLFTMQEGSMGSLSYLAADELPVHVGSQVRGSSLPKPLTGVSEEPHAFRNRPVGTRVTEALRQRSERRLGHR